MNTARNIFAKVKRSVTQEEPRIKLLRKLPKKAIGAEIGVWKGGFSSKIIEITVPKELHLIDPWLFQSEFSERMYGGKVAKKQEDMDEIYQAVRDQFKDNTRVVIHRGFSEAVLAEFEDNYLDWVYIDGNHYYEYVCKDLELSFFKVKSGGIIAGDDYTWGAKNGFPVAKAVQDFVKEKKLENKLEIISSQFIIRR
ncbi:MAG: class I SAM-dependent methyltransferase [Cyanophyceae cyanobacterium]